MFGYKLETRQPFNRLFFVPFSFILYLFYFRFFLLFYIVFSFICSFKQNANIIHSYIQSSICMHPHLYRKITKKLGNHTLAHTYTHIHKPTLSYLHTTLTPRTYPRSFRHMYTHSLFSYIHTTLTHTTHTYT